MNARVKRAMGVTGALAWLAAPAFGAPAAAGATEPALWQRAGAEGVRPAAGHTRVDESGEVKFTVSASASEVLLVAEAPGMVFEKRSTAGGVAIRVAVAGDVVRVDASRTGDVRLGRGGRSRRVRVSAGSLGHIRDAQEALAGSTALLALETLAARLADSTMAEAESVRTSYALIEAIQGRSEAARALARHQRDRGHTQSAGVRAIGFALAEATAMDCWKDYTAAVSDAFSDYEDCLRTVWWGWPLCSFEWTIRVEGSWFSYIACSGGLPV